MNPGPASPSPRIDATVVRRLLRHEAEVHAIPGRTLRDLGDAILLHDPTEPEPFWNRIEAIQWPTDASGFDRRLAEVGVLFASIGRQPHFWTLPPYDEPRDLIAPRGGGGSAFRPDKLMSLGISAPGDILTAATDALGMTGDLTGSEQTTLIDYLTDNGSNPTLDLNDYDTRNRKLHGLFALLMQMPAYQLQ